MALTALVCALVLLTGGQATAADSYALIYDVDFSSPLHTVGSAPMIGAGPITRETPTVAFGSALVVDAYGDLQDQPARLAPSGQWGGVTFGLADLPAYPSYRLELDAIVDGRLDIPLFSGNANFVNFQANGDIVVRVWEAGGGHTTTVVASYTPGDGTVHHIEILIDFDMDVFELHIDGLPAHISDFGGQSFVNALRLAGSGAAVDNIVIDSGEEDGGVSEIAASVDVKPGTTTPASINLRSAGVLPVALLGTAELAVTDVDVTTLSLTDTDGSDAVAPKRTTVEDVNDDGVADLLLQFSTKTLVSAGALSSSTVSLTLSGETLSGVPLLGSDDVRIVGKR